MASQIQQANSLMTEQKKEIREEQRTQIDLYIKTCINQKRKLSLKMMD